MGLGARLNNHKKSLISLLVGIFSLITFIFITPANAASGINQQINFQGRLLNSQGAVVPDGFYNIEFKIYQDGDGQTAGNTTGSPSGTLKWTEDYLNDDGNGVEVRNGFLSVQLGSLAAFGNNIDWNQDTLWLSMNIAGTGTSCTPFSSCGPDGEMLPMKRLTSTPYAINSGLLGGLSSAQYIQLAQGVQTDASNTSSLSVNKTGSGNIIDLQSSGVESFAINNTGDIAFGANADHTISINAAASGVAGNSLTISAGNGGGGGSAVAGGELTLKGGDAAGTGDANGGDVTIRGGSGIGSGVSGLVNLGASAFTSISEAACSSDCSITQSSVDNYGSAVVSASAAPLTITLPPPTITSAVGRIFYVTADSASGDFTLEANSGAALVDVAMRHDSTATMVWNGTAWTAAGASNATTLQATYQNGANPSTTPEIKLDSTHGTIDIQDADTSIGSDLFNIRASNATNLGTVLLGVGDTGTVTIRNNTDQQAAFRFQDAGGNYILNVNTANGYFIKNSTTALNNELGNPGFEAGAEVGGNTTFGDQGWFGNSQSVSVNDSANAHSGNHELQVTPNGTNLDVYGGGYYAVHPGDTVYFEGWVKNAAGANGTGGIELTFYDKDKSNPTSSTDYSTLPGTTYILKAITTTVPAGKYYVRPSAAVRSTASSGTYYFDDFVFTRSNSQAPLILTNSVNSAAAFKIQSSSAANTLLTANTTNNILKVGDDAGSDTDTTVLVLDSATSNPTTLTNKNGGLFYRSDSNSLKAIIGGGVYDVCTTASVCSGYGSGAGSVINLQASSPGTQQIGNFNISGTGILTQLQTQDVSSASTNSSNLTIRTGNASGTTSNSGNLVLDVGTATGSLGTIQIGHAGVTTTMAGVLQIQSANALALGSGSSATGSIRLYNNVGNNYVALSAAGANPTSSWTLTLPQNPGSSGDCLKASSGSGDLTFGNCASGVTVTLQDTYNNSSSPATLTLADNKDLRIIAQDTTTDPSILYNLQCTSCSSNGGRFAIQNGGTDVFTVKPNSGGIVMADDVQIGSATTNNTQHLLHLDSYENGSTVDDAGASCSTTTNEGAMYYNTSTQSIRACQDGSWNDVITTQDIGLLMFGVVPDSGSANPWDLAAKVTAGVSGPCKVSWASNTTVNINSCVAYSGGKRFNVTAVNGLSITGMNTTTTRWGHICLDSDGVPTLDVGTSFTANLPAFNISAPVLCLADVLGSTSSANRIAGLYDTRTFTTTVKTVATASSAFEMGMLAEAVSGSADIRPSSSGSERLRGIIVASDGGTSSTSPNIIMAIAGPAEVKAASGTAGDFVNGSTTSGYAQTTGSISNNITNFTLGNAENSFSNTCSSASNCIGSLFLSVTGPG
jgi:hypothetical protein